MSQERPVATPTFPNYAITEMPDEAAMKKYEAVVKDYVTRTRNWTEDDYAIKIRPFGAQRMLNKENCIAFSIVDKPHMEKAEKEYASTGALSTDGGRSFGVVLDIKKMQVVQEMKYM